MHGRVGRFAPVACRGLLVGMAVALLHLAFTSCSWALGEAARWHGAGGDLRALPLDLAVTTLAALVLSGCGAWLALVTGVAVVEAATGRSGGLARRLAPRVVRRALAAALGVAAVGGTAAPASAWADVCAVPDASPCPVAVAGLPLPDRAVGGPPPRPRPAAPLPFAGDGSGATRPVVSATPAPAAYVVRPGDSLWRIAAGRLPDDAPAADVVAGWREIYRINRHRVGGDPDLLEPGLRLTLPTRSPREDPS